MVNVLASRMAGLRLALVIGAVMLPFLFVTFHLATLLGDERTRTDSERSGVVYATDLMPILFAARRGEDIASASATLVQMDLALPTALLVEDHHKELVGIIQKSPLDAKLIALRASELLEIVSVNSGITHDPLASSFFLGQVATSSTPALLESFRLFEESMIGVSTGVPNAALESYAALSNWENELRKTRAAMREAQHFLSTEVSSDFAKTVPELFKPIEEFKIAFASNAAPLNLSNLLITHKSPWLASVEKNWRFSNHEFMTRLNLRLDGLKNRMNRTLGLVACACLISLGTAFSLFGSTLRRLDDLSIAKSGEERARVDAERTNERLSEINDDIVHLNRELADKMGKLKDAQDELVKKGRLEQLGQLTATVAHELRNPLGAVRTSAFLLERKIKDKGLGVEAQLLRINNGIARCDNIITQLLDFSRTKQIMASAADFDDWLEKAVEEEARKLPASVAIECHFGLDKKLVQFDPARMLRVVINLVNNASEALVGTGEDPTRFANSSPRLTIATAVLGNMVALTISDNGPGIPEELLSKIREPLFTTKSFGTGLGIPAVEQIAVQHGGRLEINSKQGEGAHFTILIPFEQQLEEAA